MIFFGLGLTPYEASKVSRFFASYSMLRGRGQTGQTPFRHALSSTLAHFYEQLH
jgi:hypothetical protein